MHAQDTFKTSFQGLQKVLKHQVCVFVPKTGKTIFLRLLFRNRFIMMQRSIKCNISSRLSICKERKSIKYWKNNPVSK